MNRSLHTVAATLVAGSALLAVASCSGASETPRAAQTSPANASPSSASPRGIVTRAEADNIVDHYQEVNNKANRSRDASLLATVEGGQLYARSKAEYEQYGTLSTKEQNENNTPFTYSQRSFHIPAQGDWFAAEATTDGKNHTFMVFEKSTDTGNVWKMVVSLFPEQALPASEAKDGLAVSADVNAPVGQLAPSAVTDAVEDLFASGGTKNGSKLSQTNDDAQRILKTHKDRADRLGPQAAVNFFPTAPLHQKIYTLTTGSGVLVVAPLAHRQENLVKNPGLQITPGRTESVYNRTPRPVVVDLFQGETAVHLPRQGKPEILDYRYAMVDSR